MESMKQTIVDLQKKNSDISNKNVHLEAMVSELEQRLQDIEEQKLLKCIEISNVPVLENEDILAIAEVVAKKLKQPSDNITNATRLKGKMDAPGIIQVELKSESVKHAWLKAVKKRIITVSEVVPNAPKDISKKPVLVKEALTTLKKNIIWQTRQELKDKLNDAFSKRGFTSPKHEQPEHNNESDDDQSDNDPSEKAPLMGSSVNLAAVAKKPEIIANVPKVTFDEKRKEELKDKEADKDKIVGSQPVKRRSSQDSPVVLSVLEDVKRIKVNNNKKEPLTNLTITQQPSLYPHLSDIETDTSHTQEEYSDCGGSRCGHYTLECIFFFLCI